MRRIRTSLQALMILSIAYLFDRVQSLIHEGLHVLWAVLNGSELQSCDIYFLGWGTSIPVGARETWHGVPQFHACIGEAGLLPYYYNPLFATVGSVVVAAVFIHYSRFLGPDILRWGVTAGAIYSGYRYALYSGGFINHPRMEGGELVPWLGDGAIIQSGLGAFALVPAVVCVVLVTIVTWNRLKDSRDVCSCIP